MKCRLDAASCELELGQVLFAGSLLVEVDSELQVAVANIRTFAVGMSAPSEPIY